MTKTFKALALLSLLTLSSALRAGEPLPPQPASDSFLEAYLKALDIYEVKSSYEELSCICGMIFSPQRLSSTSCGKDASKPYSGEYNVQRLNNFYRLRNEEAVFSPKDQVSPGKRTEYRKMISDAQKEGAPAIQYCQLPGTIESAWQFVEPGTGLTLKVTYGGKSTTFSGVPEKVWFLRKSNRPAADDAPSVFIFENIGKLLNGTTSVPFLSCGVTMLQEMADNSYSLPWCPVCKSSFNNCIYKHLLRWQYDAKEAQKLFPWLAQLVSTDEEKALLNRAEEEYGRYVSMFEAIISDPQWDKPQTDVSTQSVLGEHLRFLSNPLVSSAECFFSLANRRNSLSPEYYSPSRRSQLLSDKLANVIVNMQIDERYEGSLACSLSIAAQLSGSERPTFVLRGIAGLPVRLCLRTNDWYFCREINEGLDMAVPFLNASGFDARYVSSLVFSTDARANANIVKRVYDSAVKKLIENLSDKKHAAVGYNLNRSGQWGVIAGYTDYGFTWKGRTVLDEKPQMTEFKSLPSTMILVDKALPKPSFEDDVYLALSRFIKFIKGGSLNGVLYGNILMDYWMKELTSYEKQNQFPSPLMCSVNRSLWNTMISGRSDALAFITHLTRAVPACSIPLASAKDLLEEELTCLRSALNNGYVVGFSNDLIVPPGMKPATMSRQVDAMRQFMDLDRQLIGHLEMAQQVLQK